MSAGSLAELIAAIEAAVRKVLAAARALPRALRPGLPAKPPVAKASHFGEHERLEESKYYPPEPSYALSLEEGELPESYGETRVVLLAVDPNLVHAYWNVAPDKLREAKSRVGESSQAVLRFYEAGARFDVDIDLGPRNWYVPLWSAGKSYYVDLGLRGEGGSFVQLARSNVVHTPRAMPVVEVGERFLSVAAPERRAESVPPAPVSPAVPAGPGPPGAGLAKAPPSSEETLKEKLEEFCALRESGREPLKLEQAPVRAPGGRSPEECDRDLTDLAEERQTMGLSSPLPHGGRPER